MDFSTFMIAGPNTVTVSTFFQLAGSVSTTTGPYNFKLSYDNNLKRTLLHFSNSISFYWFRISKEVLQFKVLSNLVMMITVITNYWL